MELTFRGKISSWGAKRPKYTSESLPRDSPPTALCYTSSASDFGPAARSTAPPGEFMPVVDLAGVTKAYETKLAVNNLSLKIEAGPMFGLLGPNGAGKPSSIRMMMGITMPDSGRIDLFGKQFERSSLDRVGYLPEERGLYKKMKVLDQLVFFGELHGIGAEDARRRAMSWAARMEISDALEKK